MPLPGAPANAPPGGRIGKVTGYEYLMRLHFAEQVTYNFYICLTDRILLDFACFIEWQIQEVNAVQRNVIVCTSRTGFATANQTFDSQDIA